MIHPNKNIELPYVFVNHSANPVDKLCTHIIQSGKSNLSDLSSNLIWCESRASIHTIKLKLLAKAKNSGISSLLFPTITTLQDWVWKQEAPEKPLISETNKQLLLVEAIRQSPGLFQTNNAWPLAKELITLFNECTLAQIPLQDGEEAFHISLKKSYEVSSTNLSNISRESEIVYRLWVAYCDQIKARDWLDPVSYYAQWLAQCKKVDTDKNYYVVGMHRFTTAEKIFLHSTSAQAPLSIFIPTISRNEYGMKHHPHLGTTKRNENNTASNHPKDKALEFIYQNNKHVLNKIESFNDTFNKNIFTNWISSYSCTSAEQHAEGVSLQAKKWLLENKHPIGIIINDRLLARRIRAVFEKEGINPNDLGGWTLSTTSAATSLEILLDCIESNFKKDALTDLLSSPFLTENNLNNINYIQQLNHAKKLFAKHRNTHNDTIDTFINIINSNTDNEESDFSDLNIVIQRIKEAYASLFPSLLNNEYELADFSNHLLALLDKVGLKQSLDTDAAGKQLLATLETHINSSRHNNIKLNWKEWRQWIRDTLENNYFIPENTDQRITLCGFEHVDNKSFKSVIIAGTEHSRMVSVNSHRTFFNEKVRHELGLSTSHEQNAINFVRFRQLLSQSDEVLLTAEIENHDEPQEICSWIKMIELFSTQVFSHSLENTELIYLTQNRHMQENPDSSDLLSKSPTPAPVSPDNLIPTRISATQYQTLLDCPYQFFAKYILQLRDREINDELDASDYGQLVHQSLHEFHFKEKNKSGITFSDAHRDQLIEQLEEISTTLFMRAAFPTPVKEGWLRRWIINIPYYIDWAIHRNSEWQPLRGECLMEHKLGPELTLYGQIDRIDSNNIDHAVVDYKTGSTKPTGKKVLNGETVQLPFYALLDKKITQAEYLSLGTQGEIKSVARINENELDDLKNEHASRIANLFEQIKNETPLTANGDDSTCSYCDYEGLCRKSHWN